MLHSKSISNVILGFNDDVGVAVPARYRYDTVESFVNALIEFVGLPANLIHTAYLPETRTLQLSLPFDKSFNIPNVKLSDELEIDPLGSIPTYSFVHLLTLIW